MTLLAGFGGRKVWTAAVGLPPWDMRATGELSCECGRELGDLGGRPLQEFD
jgi:hypothetical protein